MTLEEIKDKVFNSKEYEFLWTDPHLGKDKILFLTLGGSYSYGTNIETSDVDIRGVALNTESDVLGLTTFEQREDKATDTTIYGLNKFIKLCMGCNPNIIEMLYCKPEHYIYLSPLGKILLDNRDLFLSKKAYWTFTGYANAQLNRLNNKLVRVGTVLTEEESKTNIKRSVDNCLASLRERYGFGEEDLKVYVGKDEQNNPSLRTDVNLKNFDFSNFRAILSDTSNVLKDFENNEGNRNRKATDVKLDKHMCHLIRLYLMGNEILRDHTLHTYRTVEHDLLMDIRNGKFRDEEGRVKEEFTEILNRLTEESNYLKGHNTLPQSVNVQELYNKVVYPIYKEVLFK